MCVVFSSVEDQNFALFNYVNELNGDIELVQEQIQEVHWHTVGCTCMLSQENYGDCMHMYTHMYMYALGVP